MNKRVGLAAAALVVALAVFLASCANVLTLPDTGNQALSRALITLTNPGFESSFTGWTPLSGDTIAASTGGYHSGSNAAKLVDATRSVSQTVTGLVPNSTYTLSAWIKNGGKLGVKDYGGSTVESATVTSGTYAQYSITFTTGSSNTSALIYGKGTSVTGYFDDVTLDGAAATSSPTPSPTSSASPAKFTIAGSDVTASSYDSDGGWSPDKAVDGSLSTRWAGEGDGAWIKFNLGGTKTVSYVKIAFYNGSSRTFTFDVQTSSDGSSFTNRLTGATSASNNDLQTFDFADVSASYVRIVGHNNTVNAWNSYQEVEVWGISASATASPTVAPTATATASPSPSPTASPTATPTATPTPSPTATPTPTPTPTPSGKIGVLRTIVADTAAEIHSAFTNAKPGDLIKISAGTYTGDSSASGYSNAYFALQKSGTAANPIYVESETSTIATLQGSSNSSKYVFYVKGNYVRLSNLKITKGKQGLMTDQSSNAIYTNLEVWNIGQEGIHIRDGSSNVVIDGCKVHDTGVGTPDYGEGIYVGSDYTKWTENGGDFDKACDNVVIRNSTLGPNCAAEVIDIKEGSTGTIVEYNTMDATGLSGANSADSFMDIKGNGAIIRYNTARRNGASNLNDAFQTNEKSTGWGFNNDIHHNTVYMDGSSGYVVNVKAGSARVSANTRSPSGSMYTGDYTEY